MICVVNVGEVPKTRTPEPVSSEIAPEIPADVVRPVKAEVPLPRRRPVSVEAPEPPLDTARGVPSESEPREAVAANKFVDDAVVLKKLVVVAEVPVAVLKVKSVRVEDAVERKPFRKPRVVEVALP